MNLSPLCREDRAEAPSSFLNADPLGLLLVGPGKLCPAGKKSLWHIKGKEESAQKYAT